MSTAAPPSYGADQQPGVQPLQQPYSAEYIQQTQSVPPQQPLSGQETAQLYQPQYDTQYVQPVQYVVQPAPVVMSTGQPTIPTGEKNPSNYQSAVPLQQLTSTPAPIDCPACGYRMLTKIEYKTGGATHAWALILCFLTLCLTPLPYCMNSLKDVLHSCGHCGKPVALWHKSGHTDVLIHR